MLNCQNVSTFKKMLYCLFLFRFLNVRPGNASKFLQNPDKNLLASYISAIAFFVSRRTVIWKLLRTNIR